MMKNRKGNRLKGYDYSRNNLYFITNCVKNNVCCLGRVVAVGTGRDLSVQHRVYNPINHHQNHPIINPKNNHPNNPSENIFIINPKNNHPNNPSENIPIINPKNNHPNNPSESHFKIQSEVDSINQPGSKYISKLNKFGEVVANRIRWLSNQYEYIEIHNFVVMPNHFHLILEIDATKVKDNQIKIKSVSSLIGALKSTASYQIRQLGFVDFEWHRSFHDHIIKTDKAYQNISNYIDKNPEKWYEDRFFVNV